MLVLLLLLIIVVDVLSLLMPQLAVNALQNAALRAEKLCTSAPSTSVLCCSIAAVDVLVVLVVDVVPLLSVFLPVARVRICLSLGVDVDVVAVPASSA